MNNNSLRVRLSGRLGNNIFQLVNSIVYCHINEIDEIVLYSAGWQHCGDNIASFMNQLIRVASGLEIRVEHNTDRLLDEYRIMLDEYELNQDIVKYLGSDENLDLVAKDTYSFLADVFRDAERRCDSREVVGTDGDYVVIHLRGDDVFGKGVVDYYGIPRRYVQPPLCFYKNLASELSERIEGIKIRILAQDRRNPVLLPLFEYLQKRGIKSDIVFANLSECIVLLLHAKYVISSRGTFIPAILLGSSRVPNVYYFREEECNHLNRLTGKSMKRYIVHDKMSKYTVQGDWMCLPHQIKMMLRYPQAALSQAIRID